jgi:hypothetical protein
LVSAAYCRAETVKNLAKFAPQATAHWHNLQSRIEWVPNALTTKRPLLPVASDWWWRMIVSVSKKTSALRRGLVNGSAAVCVVAEASPTAMDAA